MPAPTKKISIRRLFRDVLLLAALGFAMTALGGYTKSLNQFWLVGSFTALLWILLWKGNAEMSNFLESKIDWFNQPFRSLAILSIGTIVYTVGVVFLLMQIYMWLADIDFGDSKLTVYSATLITIVISLFMHGRSFLINWKQSALDAEKLKRESVTAQYESLKNQVNPHFLFNSLNALTGLVYEDQDKAAKFIKQLSEVYRYVLDTKDMEVVSVDEELKFLDAYLFLQQIRFGYKLRIDNKLANLHGSLPPLAIQMLIENAIKHNVISEESPLTIKLYGESGYIVVENNLQVKRLSPSDSSGLGLENIKKRYEFLDNRKVIINNVNNIFQVRIPLLIEIS
jgi:hypothetical protein